MKNDCKKLQVKGADCVLQLSCQHLEWIYLAAERKVVFYDRRTRKTLCSLQLHGTQSELRFSDEENGT